MFNRHIFVIKSDPEGAILTAIQNGLQEVMFEYQKRIEEELEKL